MMDDDYLARFGGMARLYGTAGLERIRKVHVAVIGIGGVGSWVVESLARSGVGRLTLVDLDDVCVSNVNRQLHALQSTIGMPKVEVMAQRVRDIHPGVRVEVRSEFFTSATSDAILSEPFDLVVDAIDSLSNKCLLITSARKRQLPLVVCGAAGGRRDPTKVRVADLAETSHDILLMQVRRELRRHHGFPRESVLFGIPTIYTTELPVYPLPDGTVCATKPEPDGEGALKLNCDAGFGSASFVTGVFGLTAASVVVQALAAPPKS